MELEDNIIDHSFATNTTINSCKKVYLVRISEMLMRDAYLSQCNPGIKGNVGEYIQEAAINSVLKEVCGRDADICSVSHEQSLYSIKEEHDNKLFFPTSCIGINVDNLERFLEIADKIQFPIFFLYLYDDLIAQSTELYNLLKGNEPIGCRCDKTKEILSKHNIKAYITGCPTVALARREYISDKGVPFLIDVSSEAMRFIPDEIKSKAIVLSHATQFQPYPPTDSAFQEQYQIACERLELYKTHASLVISSRLHCVAPCVAMGVPTVLMTDNADYRYMWVDKLLPIYQKQDYPSIKWDEAIMFPDVDAWLKNQIHELYRRYICHENYEEIMASLDSYYSVRRETVYFKCFVDTLKKIKDDGAFKYLIWGGGVHSGYAIDLIQQYNKNAVPVAIVDRFKYGRRKYGLDIVAPEEFNNYSFDKIVITTNQGLEDATSMIINTLGDKYLLNNCIMLHSQQVS